MEAILNDGADLMSLIRPYQLDSLLTGHDFKLSDESKEKVACEVCAMRVDTLSKREQMIWEREGIVHAREKQLREWELLLEEKKCKLSSNSINNIPFTTNESTLLKDFDIVSLHKLLTDREESCHQREIKLEETIENIRIMEENISWREKNLSNQKLIFENEISFMNERENCLTDREIIVKKAEENILSKENELSIREKCLSTRENIILQREETVHEHMNLLHSKENSLNDRERLVCEREKLLYKQSEKIQSMECVIISKESVLKEKDRVLQDRVNVFQNQMALLQKHEKLISEKENTLEAKLRKKMEISYYLRERKALLQESPEDSNMEINLRSDIEKVVGLGSAITNDSHPVNNSSISLVPPQNYLERFHSDMKGKINDKHSVEETKRNSSNSIYSILNSDNCFMDHPSPAGRKCNMESENSDCEVEKEKIGLQTNSKEILQNLEINAIDNFVTQESNTSTSSASKVFSSGSCEQNKEQNLISWEAFLAMCSPSSSKTSNNHSDDTIVNNSKTPLLTSKLLNYMIEKDKPLPHPSEEQKSSQSKESSSPISNIIDNNLGVKSTVDSLFQQNGSYVVKDINNTHELKGNSVMVGKSVKENMKKSNTPLISQESLKPNMKHFLSQESFVNAFGSSLHISVKSEEQKNVDCQKKLNLIDEVGASTSRESSLTKDQNPTEGTCNELFKTGTRVKNSKKKNRTALLDALTNGSLLDIVSVLDSQNVELEVRDADGRTPLLLAVAKSYTQLAQRLLDLGANYSVCDYDGRSSLHLAANSKDLKITTLLLDKGIDPHLTDNYGQTAAHLAAKYGNNIFLQKMTEMNVNMYIKDNEGNTVTDILRKSNVSREN